MTLVNLVVKLAKEIARPVVVWSGVVEMGESRTVELLFVDVHLGPQRLDFSGFARSGCSGMFV